MTETSITAGVDEIYPSTFCPVCGNEGRRMVADWYECAECRCSWNEERRTRLLASSWARDAEPVAWRARNEMAPSGWSLYDTKPPGLDGRVPPDWEPLYAHPINKHDDIAEVNAIIERNPYTTYSFPAQNDAVERQRASRYARMIAIAAMRGTKSAAKPKYSPLPQPSDPPKTVVITAERLAELEKADRRLHDMLPLFEEARDAITALTVISLSLADRMD